MSEWISVEEELPEIMSLCWYKGDYEFCIMIGGSLTIHKDGMWHIADDEISHWMPLPQPPENTQ